MQKQGKHLNRASFVYRVLLK